MKQNFSLEDRTELEYRISEAEKHTKTQIVLATIERSDTYEEIPWKAFALGASVTGLLAFLLYLLFPGWLTDMLVIVLIAVPLAAGILCVFLTLLFPGFAKLFLTAVRAETEALQYAESLFLDRELYATSKRNGILVLVSQFERKVVILPDKGLSSRLNADVLRNIIMQMSLFLAKDEIRLAMETGLEGLIRVLDPLVSAGPEKDELPNEIIERESI
jgi:putative membrane protein